MTAGSPHRWRSHASGSLHRPLASLRGVGPATAAGLQEMGLRRVGDLLFHFPRRYTGASCLTSLKDLSPEEPGEVALCGRVVEVATRRTRKGRLTGIVVEQDGHYLRAYWFNVPYVAAALYEGASLVLTGKPRWDGAGWEMFHPRFRVLEPGAAPETKLRAVYPAVPALKQSQLRQAVRAAWQAAASDLHEILPETLLRRRQLPNFPDALRWIHFPENRQQAEAARRRFAYQELLLLQLALALHRWQIQQRAQAPAFPRSPALEAAILRRLPFRLTHDQRRAVEEILDDLARPVPMRRLLHGEVASGKTAVAMVSLLAVAARGYQAVLVTPTAILADQHYRRLAPLLEGTGWSAGVLTGSSDTPARRQVVERFRSGELKLLVATHAVLHHPVGSSRLALVIVDEQHKFGVGQRGALRRLGADVHYLVMSATPIPRTVAMTWLGDLDVSRLQSRPGGAADVRTVIVTEPLRQRWWEFFRGQVLKGAQGYVICPWVGTSGQSHPVPAVEELFERLANGLLADCRVEMVHGRMPSAHNQRVLQRFRQGAIQVLVASSLLEVGVDVPRATLMSVEGADRFGLSQLHQLRGRIGRAGQHAWLGLVVDRPSPQSRHRLEIFARTQDGFQLAQWDLRLRGPGEIFSSRQHGLPAFRVADLRRDEQLLHWARQDAALLMDRFPGLNAQEVQPLREKVLRRYGRALSLADLA